MATQGKFLITKDVNGEGSAILKVFRTLSDEEQRIVCAILDGMRIQKELNTQSDVAHTAGSGQDSSQRNFGGLPPPAP